MVRRRPPAPAVAMPHATPAWPQALPRGSGVAQPRAYHDPSDFRLWEPGVGARGTRQNARLLGLLGRPRFRCRRRPAFPIPSSDEGLRGHEKTRGGLRPRNSNKTELRLYTAA